jgi:hypothetical protein
MRVFMSDGDRRLPDEEELDELSEESILSSALDSAVASVLVIEPVETAEEIREFISDRGDCVENVICDIDCFSDPVEGSHPLIVVNQW